MENVKVFCKVRGQLFLTKEESTGNNKTFYMHCLRFYLLLIARKILEDHHLGVRMFTMQGFEHQNKVLKYLWNKFNNYTKHVLIQKLNCVYGAYHHDCCN